MEPQMVPPHSVAPGAHSTGPQDTEGNLQNSGTSWGHASLISRGGEQSQVDMRLLLSVCPCQHPPPMQGALIMGLQHS